MARRVMIRKMAFALICVTDCIDTETQIWSQLPRFLNARCQLAEVGAVQSVPDESANTRQT